MCRDRSAGCRGSRPVILKLFDYDKASDALGMRLQIAAMLCGFVTNPNGGRCRRSSQRAWRTARGLVDGLEPGMLKTLAPGEDMRWSDPPDLGAESIQFLTLTAREIAAGLGLPYEALSGDLSQVNYSSIRAGLVEWRRRCEALQHGVIAFQVLRPLYRRWITGEVLRGALAAPGFFERPGAVACRPLYAAAQRLGRSRRRTWPPRSPRSMPAL